METKLRSFITDDFPSLIMLLHFTDISNWTKLAKSTFLKDIESITQASYHKLHTSENKETRSSLSKDHNLHIIVN